MKKIVSLILVLIMVVSAIPISAQAASTTHSPHPICGSSCSCVSDSHSNYTSWTAWDGTTQMYNGNYYLTKDIVLDSTMILNYGYQTLLCLNGHSITCDDAVFDIYSNRSIWITDCKGTGKIESFNDVAIRNNKYVSVWGGTIKGDFSAIESYSGTTTFVCGGKVTASCQGIYAYPNSDIRILGGEVYGEYAAISGHGQTSYSPAKIKISGGTLKGDIDAEYASLNMSGGYVDGSVCIFSEDVTAGISGGTITGELNSYAKTISITGGSFNNSFLFGDTTISKGTFNNYCKLFENNTISGGDFTGCSTVDVSGTAWIYGGSFGEIVVYKDSNLYLSANPEIDTLTLVKGCTISAQDADLSSNYTGSSIKVVLDDYYSEKEWKDGDIVIRNVTTDAVAEKFVLETEDSRWVYLEHSGNNLVLRSLPHGTWGSNATWGIEDGTLTISGTGALQYTHSGREYPWGDYADSITKIIVEPGITKIPAYTFEYCEKAETIILPETVTTLNLNAFNDCGSLNNLVIPSSVLFVEGMSNSTLPAFIRCESLTDMYYLGTSEEWKLITQGRNIINYDSTMTKHFLQYYESTATCTEPGIQAYYQFDNISVYDGYYNEDKKPIVQPETVPATGHKIVVQEEKQVEPLILDNSDLNPFEFKGGIYYSTNSEKNSSSELQLYACHPVTLTMEVETQSGGVVSYYHNGKYVDEDYYLKGYEFLTLNLKAGDTVSIVYNKYDEYSGRIGVKFTYDMPTIVENAYISADTVEPNCTEAVVCDYCQAVVKEALGHRVIMEQETLVVPVTVENTDSVPFNLIDGKYYSNNHNHSSSSQFKIKAQYDCTLKLNYGVSSESGYDKLYILQNGTQKDMISGAVSGKNLTLTLSAGDEVIVRYSKDVSVSSGNDQGWVALDYDLVTDLADVDVKIDSSEMSCGESVDCAYCEETVSGTATHQMGDWTVVTNATCTEAGSKMRECGQCGYSETEVIEAYGHDYDAVVTAPTCTEQGYTTYTCECGDSYIDDYVDALGHSYTSEITTPATHTTTGVMTYTCNCGDTYTEKIAKIEKHNYESVVTAPTCTEQGYTTYTCECGDSYIDDYVDALGHKEETVPAVAPSCTETGLAEGVKCSACGETLTEQKELPANGHTPINAVEENYIAPSCTEKGSKDLVVYCSVCDEEISRETVVLETTGHADNDGDGYCDEDNELLDPTVECNCNCHKTGLSKFFFKLILFFQRLFGSNKTCACGIAHY